jgi:dihydroorotate dehydrogenase (fumarate)
MNLTTTYLGLRLPHPLVVGAGPLTDELDRVRELEDAGAAALVMRSLFEEEITGEQMDEYLRDEQHNDSFAEAGSFTADPIVSLGPDEYLEHLRRVKAAVSIPVMASLNGMTRGGWTSYARMLEQAGADALELHIFHAASDMTKSAADVERDAIEIAADVKRTVRIPVAVKLAPLLTAFAHFAKQLDVAGVDGFVLFTRYQRIDIDVEELEIVRTTTLSDSSELTMRLRGAAALSGRVRGSIALSGGVHTALDVVKATMSGAHSTQMVSALLRHGPSHIGRVLGDLRAWLVEHEWPSLSEMRGNMSLERIPDPAAYERANFRSALSLRHV